MKRRWLTVVLAVLFALIFLALAIYGIFIKPRIAVCTSTSHDGQNSIDIFSYCPPYKYYANEQITIICKSQTNEVMQIKTEVSNDEVRITPESGNVLVTWDGDIANIVLTGSQQPAQIITIDFDNLAYTTQYAGRQRDGSSVFPTTPSPTVD